MSHDTGLVETIIIGSGAAGASAALGLARAQEKPVMLDVGYPPEPVPGLDGNIFEVRRRSQDLFGCLVGENFESLHNLHKRKISLKLKSPGLQYIIKDSERLSPVSEARNFEGVMSFAQGGLANAWGAGVFRFNDADLEGFPLTADELAPHYAELTEHVGISGTSDDLDPWFGPAQGLLPPLELSRIATRLFGGYARHREHFRAQGLAIGRPRLAVASVDHRGRRRYDYENLEFFKPHLEAVYSPAFTVRELAEKGELDYRPGVLVERFVEHGDHVEVLARGADSGEPMRFLARRLILAAGALNSAKLVLASRGDTSTRLPLLDNPMACVPLFHLPLVGARFEPRESNLGQACIVYEGADRLVQGTFYGTGGPLRTDMLFDFPLTVGANLAAARYLAPAIGVFMLFYPGRQDPDSFLRLTPEGSLDISFAPQPKGPAEKAVIKAFRKIGFYGHQALCMYPAMGQGIHYAGLLPMRRNPGRYETDRWGRLEGSDKVYVVDGACFSSLPAKNLTFTVMANALRIAGDIVAGRA